MRHTFRLALAVAVALLATSGTRAQQAKEFSTTNVFTFAPAPSTLTAIPKADIDKTLSAKAELKLRPNAATELYLWVLNPHEADDEFIVELSGPVAARAKVSIPGNTWVPVRLPKPAAPAPAPVVPPVVVVTPPAGGAAPPAPEPPPPGIEVPLVKGDRKLTLRLLDKNGVSEKDANEKLYGNDFAVGIRSTSDYVKAPVATVTPGKTSTGVKVIVAQDPAYLSPGSAAIQLVIPPQEALKGVVIRDGFYRRTLTFDPADPASAAVTLSGTIENASEKACIYVGVDGIDRAFAYTLNPLGKTPATQLLRARGAAVRVSLVAGPAITAPVGKVPVLIEVDNPDPNDRLELRLTPLGAGKDLTEKVKFDALRDTRVWLDPAGPTDGGLLFTTRSRDWVKPLDLTHLRGKVEVVGVLETKERFVYSDPLILTVDATPPERIRFLPIDAQLVKGKPLVVAAAVNDPETVITRATFFLFKQLDDGKIPADAVKGVGFPTAKDPNVWTADLAVPADFRGPGVVAVVFANEAGLVNDPPRIQKIEIVDAKPGTATIEGTVTFGDRLQPGVAVSIRDADGKEKSATKTDEKGRFKFVRVPPGSYRLAALKKDSSTGASADLAVVAEADKTTKVPVTLEKVRR